MLFCLFCIFIGVHHLIIFSTDKLSLSEKIDQAGRAIYDSFDPENGTQPAYCAELIRSIENFILRDYKEVLNLFTGLIDRRIKSIEDHSMTLCLDDFSRLDYLIDSAETYKKFTDHLMMFFAELNSQIAFAESSVDYLPKFAVRRFDAFIGSEPVQCTVRHYYENGFKGNLTNRDDKEIKRQIACLKIDSRSTNILNFDLLKECFEHFLKIQSQMFVNNSNSWVEYIKVAILLNQDVAEFYLSFEKTEKFDILFDLFFSTMFRAPHEAKLFDKKNWLVELKCFSEELPKFDKFFTKNKKDNDILVKYYGQSISVILSLLNFSF